jgi:hypothetical protein
MPYNLKLADSVSITVEDDIIYDRTILPLTIFGKSDTIDCGESLQNNFYYLLETYGSADAILAPTPGMIWFDPSDNKLKIYTDASVWKHILFESDTVERLEIVDQTGNNRRSETGQMLKVNRVWPKTSSINVSNYTWYYNGTELTTGIDVIIPEYSGVYHVTYHYDINPGNTVYMRSIDYKVRTARPRLEITRTISIMCNPSPVVNSPLDASLYDSAFASYNINWQSSVTDTSPVSTYTPIRPGDYIVIAKYVDLNTNETISVKSGITVN